MNQTHLPRIQSRWGRNWWVLSQRNSVKRGRLWSNRRTWCTVARRLGQRELCNDPRNAKQHYNTTANQVVHQLLLNGRTPNKHPKAGLNRKRYPNDPGFTRSFNETEIKAGITEERQGNRRSRWHPNRTHLTQHFGPKARDWLLRLFNNCVNSNKIPKLWWKAKVIALKDPSDASFRPIALPCHTYKLLERLILHRLAEHVDSKIIREQAGFRPGKSYTGQLLNLTEHVEDGFER